MTTSSSRAMTEIEYPGLQDALFGRGGFTTCHSGNCNYRTLASEYRDAFKATGKNGKIEIAKQIVARWRSQSPPGRFLVMSDPSKGKDSLWHDIGDAEATKKVIASLRQRKPKSELMFASVVQEQKQKVQQQKLQKEEEHSETETKSKMHNSLCSALLNQCHSATSLAATATTAATSTSSTSCNSSWPNSSGTNETRQMESLMRSAAANILNKHTHNSGDEEERDQPCTKKFTMAFPKLPGFSELPPLEFNRSNKKNDNNALRNRIAHKQQQQQQHQQEELSLEDDAIVPSMSSFDIPSAEDLTRDIFDDDEQQQQQDDDDDDISLLSCSDENMDDMDDFDLRIFNSIVDPLMDDENEFALFAQ